MTHMNMKPFCVHLLAASLFCLTIALGDDFAVHEKRLQPLLAAIDRHPVESEALLPMRIGLKQNKHALAQAEEWLMAVSHPSSPNYGRHWNQEDVIEAFKPTDLTVQAVGDWLSSYEVNFTLSDNSLWLAFDMPAANAEKMLATQYFEHRLSNGRFEVSADQYSLPQGLLEHIDYIKPGVKASGITGRTKRSLEFHKNGECPTRNKSP